MTRCLFFDLRMANADAYHMANDMQATQSPFSVGVPSPVPIVSCFIIIVKNVAQVLVPYT